MTVDHDLIETLSEREMDVLRLLAEGKTNPEIGEALGIRFQTAKWYVSEVLQKLQVPSREAAAAEYRRYNRAPARMRRALAGVPLFAKWGATGAAVLATAAVLFYAVASDFRGGGERQWLLAYLSTDRLIEEPAPERIHIVDPRSGERWDFGPSDHWAAIQWSPDGTHLLALSASNELSLFSYPDGGVLDLQQVGQPRAFALPEDYRLDQVRWSPDGSRFFVGASLYRSNGELIVPLDDVPDAYSWAPDSELLALRYPDRIDVVSRNGSRVWTHESTPAAAVVPMPVTWLSNKVLAVPVEADRFEFGYGHAPVDLSCCDDPALGSPKEPEAVLLDRWPFTEDEYDQASGLIEALPATHNDVPGVITAGATPKTFLSIYAQASDPSAPIRPVELAVTDGNGAFLVEVVVRWTIPSPHTSSGQRVDFVIRD